MKVHVLRLEVVNNRGEFTACKCLFVGHLLAVNPAGVKYNSCRKKCTFAIRYREDAHE